MVISDLLTGERKSVSDQGQELARKFIKFHHFHYYSNIGLFVGNPPVIADNFKEILQQEKGPFNYVINSIIEGLPINSADRWIEES